MFCLPSTRITTSLRSLCTNCLKKKKKRLLQGLYLETSHICVISSEAQEKPRAKRVDLFRGEKSNRVDVSLQPEELELMDNVLSTKYKEAREKKKMHSQRQAYIEKEDNKKLKQKQRERMYSKMGKMDIDYQVLHDTLFKYQTKPKLTSHSDLYHEGKEFEVKLREMKPEALSQELKEALAKFGYHPGGWGNPLVDEFGRSLYGGTLLGMNHTYVISVACFTLDRRLFMVHQFAFQLGIGQSPVVRWICACEKIVKGKGLKRGGDGNGGGGKKGWRLEMVAGGSGRIKITGKKMLPFPF
ncbi:hypothetical protein LguiA_004450 [Lonicera macranthoides]